MHLLTGNEVLVDVLLALSTNVSNSFSDTEAIAETDNLNGLEVHLPPRSGSKGLVRESSRMPQPSGK